MALDLKPMASEAPLAVSIPKLSRLCGISETTLYMKANEGVLTGCKKLGKRWLVHLETFERWLTSDAEEA